MFLIFHLVLKGRVFVNMILLVINQNKTEMYEVFLFKPGFGNVTKKLYVEFWWVFENYGIQFNNNTRFGNPFC